MWIQEVLVGEVGRRMHCLYLSDVADSDYVSTSPARSIDH